MDWDTIDMDHASVEIDYKILRVKGAGLLRVRRTNSDAGHRTLPLPLFAMRMLERRIVDADGVRPLFPDAHGGWRDPSNLSRELREARGSGEFAWVTSHVFRKTCAGVLHDSGLSPREIADQLGHANLRTLEHYIGRRAVGEAAATALEVSFGVCST
ncbi:hypothetical protein PA7_07660 [Pseudonocardia asaccharolytica DSM 44247 = NBRC 16224]|uniref:Tyr recombinase domain-containing protein n=1 Tax=Pseudonocardia asaccharolytica DSM 44247 = NBRC 16224 TaxID=1123024 RepID=A0A511CWI6_9PSEU|nr:hypothetical protein PA7_07660 [Pseudonocardia asaccharolytica DSM 44247 = NBRC 16224]